jgi:hypothetical protein
MLAGRSIPYKYEKAVRSFSLRINITESSCLAHHIKAALNLFEGWKQFEKFSDDILVIST